MNNFRFEDNKIIIEFDDIEFDDTLKGKQLENIKQKIKQREAEVDNLRKLLPESVTNEEY